MEKNKKHILLVTPGFAANEENTTCIPPLYLYVKEFICQYPEWRISIISLHFPFTSHKYEFSGAMVYPLNGKNKKYSLTGILLKNRFLKTFYRLHREAPVDCIHSFWLDEASYYASTAAKTFQIPHLCTLMGQDALKLSWRGKKTLSKKNISLVTLSAFHNDMLFKTTGVRASTIIPWGIDEEHESNRVKEFDIMGAGSLIDVKNYGLFLDIVKQVQGKIPDLKVILCGKGGNEAMLRKQAEKNNLNNVVHFTGECSRGEVLSYMKKSKFFLHTASFESFGYVLAEALSCGCRVVSTPVGFASGNPHISIFTTIEQATGILLEKNGSVGKEKIHIPKMRDTVATYEKLYDSIIAAHE